MYQEKLERICALLCLLSGLERREDDPAPLSRRTVRAMLRAGALEGLVLRKTKGISSKTFERAKQLLARASAVYARLQAYQRQGYAILLEGDERWPKQLEKLGEEMPLYLFVKGNAALLGGKKVSVAGSRMISERTEKKAQAIGRNLAMHGLALVTGGARGVDNAAAQAALCAGGSVIVIPAMRAQEFFINEGNRRDCEEGRLLLLCETPPDEPFSAKKALTRNHTIYALGEAAMVVASRRGIGGSWSGAHACLKHDWSPLYILDEEGAEFEGNAALIKMGAMRMQVVVDAGHEEVFLQGPDEQNLRKLTQRRQMPALVRIPIAIDRIPRSETLRCLGWAGQALDAQVLHQIEEAERMALECINPAAVIGEFELEEDGALCAAEFKPEGEAVGLLLDGCQGAVLLAVTLGAQSERQLLRMQAMDTAMATILDAVFSSAIEAAADRISEIVSARAAERGRKTTGRFSPGYGDMPMRQTGEILAALDAERKIGLTVSAKGLMMPRKSVCAIIGEGKGITKNSRNGCAFCAHRESCKGKRKCACAWEG